MAGLALDELDTGGRLVGVGMFAPGVGRFVGVGMLGFVLSEVVLPAEGTEACWQELGEESKIRYCCMDLKLSGYVESLWEATEQSKIPRADAVLRSL